MIRFIITRLLIGAAVLLSASLGASSTSPAAAVATPIAASPLMLHLDIAAMTATPEPTPVVTATPTPEPQSNAERFRVALARSSWPLAAYPLVEARVACENTTYEPAKTRVEDDGSLSIGLLQVNAGAHPDLARDYDLTDPLQNLNAGKIVADRHARAGLPTPWQHCDAEIAR